MCFRQRSLLLFFRFLIFWLSSSRSWTQSPSPCWVCWRSCTRKRPNRSIQDDQLLQSIDQPDLTSWLAIGQWSSSLATLKSSTRPSLPGQKKTAILVTSSRHRAIRTRSRSSPGISSLAMNPVARLLPWNCEESNRRVPRHRCLRLSLNWKFKLWCSNFWLET